MAGNREYPRLRRHVRDSAEYQKIVRGMRRNKIPMELADKAAIEACKPRKFIFTGDGDGL